MRRSIVFSLTIAMVLMLSAPAAFADGTETLGPPSVAIAEGSGVEAAGVGMVAQPRLVNITVPSSATVAQTLLYWNGFHSSPTGGADDTISVNGNAVTGTLIGGPTLFFGTSHSSTYRADITALGLVTAGANTLTLSDMSFDLVNNGAGVLVIFDDGTVSDISIVDGSDLAFVNFASPLDTTVAQTLSFAPEPVDRVADLDMFFSSVAGQDLPGERPSIIRITAGATVTDYADLLASNDGEEWDTLNLAIGIPAGVDSITIQALSEDGLGTGNLPASFAWNASALSVPVTPPAASLGDFVFEDTNGNGIQDAGEPGILGVPVSLLDCDGNELATATTDSSGFYEFTNLTPGCYQVAFGTPDGYTPSPANQGGDDTIDSDAVNGVTGPIDLESGENDPTNDAGFVPVPLAGLGDFVFEDLNADGIQDAGEPGIEGVTVNLLDCSGDPLGPTTTTDPDGFYAFTGLEAGCYQVEFEAPAGYEPSPANQGGDDTIDSDAVNGVSGDIDLDPGEFDPTIDAGFYQPASLGDFVFEDTNGNGIQDAGEPGILGVPVSLLDCDGNELATATTDSSGFYEFTNLTPGCYQVAFGTPDGYTPSPANQGGDDTIDSDAVNGVTGPIDLESGENDPTNDAGFVPVPLAGLGDFVFEDLNADGIQDAGEPGIEGVTVNLLDCSGDPLGPTTTTDPDGFYAFTGLEAGCYQVEFEAPAGYEPSPANQGGDDTIDSDAVNGVSGDIDLDPGEFDPTIDAGFYQPASLGDFVFEDTNGNGIQDAGEPGILGVPVSLLDCDGNELATATTDSSGFYEFTNLTPGCYQVAFGTPDGYTPSPANQGGDDTIDSDAVNGVTGPIDLESGENDPTNDAGFVPADPGIDIEKLTNGNQADGANDADVPQIAPGDPVTWTYIVTNTGNVPFDVSDVVVTDDIIGAITNIVDQGDGDAVLSPGEVWLYEAAGVAPDLEFGTQGLTTIVAGCNPDGTSVPGDRPTYENIGQVTVPGDSDTDPSHYCNPPEASIDIEKLVQVVSDAAGDVCETYGKPVALTFEYQPGTTVSTNQDPSKATASGVADDDGSAYIDAGSLFTGTVNVGETIVLAGSFGSNTVIKVYDSQGGALLQTIEYHTSCSQPITIGDVVGSVVLIGYAGQDGAVTVSDPVDADTPTGPEATIGSTVEFTYIVTNTGETIIDPAVVTDDNGTADPSDDFSPTFVGGDDGDGLLEPGEQWAYTSTSTAILGQYRNDAGVIGTPVDEAGTVLGPDVTDTDPAHYIGIFPQGDLCDVYDNPQVMVFELTGASLTATDGNAQDPGKVELTPDPSIALSGDLWVVAGNKDLTRDNADEVYFSGPVTVGDLFTVDSRMAGKDKISNPLFINIYSADPATGGTIVQTIEIHTSCSQPIRLGDTYGSVTLFGLYDKNGNGDGVEPTPMPPSAMPLCEVLGKPVELTFVYEPGSVVATSQNADKAFVTGTPDNDSTAYVVVASTDKLDEVYQLKSDKIYFNGTVATGDEFVASAANIGKDDFESKTLIFVFEDEAAFLSKAAPLQTAEYHTSCSQPIFLGDTIGSVELIGYVGKDGSVGEVPEIEPDGVAVCEVLGKPVELTFVYEPGSVVATSQNADKAFVTGTPDNDSTAYVVVASTDKLDEVYKLKSDKIYFNGTVATGDEFVASAANIGKDDFESKTLIFVFEDEAAFLSKAAPLQTAEYHTSCSQPIFLGDTIGSVELIGYVGKEGSLEP